MHTPENEAADTADARALKGKTGIRRIIHATGYSRDGLRAAWSEAAFRQLAWLNGVLMVLVWFLEADLAVKMLLFSASVLSLITELINTGIEAAVDHTSLARHPLAKRAKDVGSAAQMLAMGLLAVLWLLALWGD